jgi:hypothetical protein
MKSASFTPQGTLEQTISQNWWNLAPEYASLKNPLFKEIQTNLLVSVKFDPNCFCKSFRGILLLPEITDNFMNECLKNALKGYYGLMRKRSKLR